MRPEWCYGYVRFYSDETVSDVPKQIIEEFAKDKGYKLQGIIVEQNVPYRDSFDFPGLKELFYRLRKNDHILLINASHINRDLREVERNKEKDEDYSDSTYMREAVDFLEEIRKYRGKLTLIREKFPFDTTKHGDIALFQTIAITTRLSKAMLSINNEKYIKRIKELEEQVEQLKASKN